MIKKQSINDFVAKGDVEASNESFAYCQTCQKILNTSGDLDKVKQFAADHKLEPGFENHKAGFTLESYVLND